VSGDPGGVRDLRLAGLNNLAHDIHQNAVRHGFWPDGVDGRNFGEICALLHSEITEMMEEDRVRGHLPKNRVYYRFESPEPNLWQLNVSSDGKPMRLTDSRTADSIYEPTREQLRERGWRVKPEGVPSELADLIIRALEAAGAYGIDIEQAIEEKMAYNRQREYRHGNKRY